MQDIWNCHISNQFIVEDDKVLIQIWSVSWWRSGVCQDQSNYPHSPNLNAMHMIWGTFVTLSEETDCIQQQVSLIYHSYLLMPRSMVCILCWLKCYHTWINWVIWQSRQSLKVVLCLLVVAGYSRKPVRIGMPRCLFRIKFLHALIGSAVNFMLQMLQCSRFQWQENWFQDLLYRMRKYIVTIIIIMTRKGKYMVREDIEKAPTHDHPCNLTRCVYSWTCIFQSLSIFHPFLPPATITIKCYNFLSGFV